MYIDSSLQMFKNRSAYEAARNGCHAAGVRRYPDFRIRRGSYSRDSGAEIGKIGLNPTEQRVLEKEGLRFVSVALPHTWKVTLDISPAKFRLKKRQ